MSGLTEKISWIVDLNESSVTRGFKNIADGAEKHLGTAEKKLANFGGAGSFSGLDGAANKVNGILSSVGSSAEVTGAQLGGALAIGAAAAGIALVGLAIKGIDTYTKLVGEARLVSQVTGATMEDSSRLAAAFRLVGVDVDTAASALGKLAKSLGQHSDLLKKYHVEVASAKDGTVDMKETLINIAEAWKSTEDPTKRAALASAAFGKGYVALLPILAKGAELRDKLKETPNGLVFSDKDSANAKALAESMRALHETVDSLQVSLAKGIVPVLTTVVGQIDSAIKGAEKLASLPGFGRSAKVGIDLAIGKPVDAVKEIWHGLFGEPAKQAKASTDDINAALAQTTAQADAAAKEVDTLAKEFVKLGDGASAAKTAIVDNSKAIDAVVTAQSTLRSSMSSLTKAQETLSKLREEGSGPSIRSAEQSYHDALLASASATDGVRTAQERLNRARREASSGLTQAEAELKILEAQAALTSAQERGSVHRGSLDDKRAQVDTLTSQLDLQDAQRQLAALKAGKNPNLDAAEQGVSAALNSQAAAQDRVIAARSSAARAAQDYATKVKDAEQSVSDALQKVSDASEKAAKTYVEALDAAKPPLDRFNEALDTQNAKQSAALAAIQSLKDRGYGDLAAQLSKMGPDGFDLLIAAQKTGDAAIDKTTAKLSAQNDQLDRFKLLAGDLVNGTNLGPPDRGGIDYKDGSSRDGNGTFHPSPYKAGPPAPGMPGGVPKTKNTSATTTQNFQVDIHGADLTAPQVVEALARKSEFLSGASRGKG